MTLQMGMTGLPVIEGEDDENSSPTIPRNRSPRPATLLSLSNASGSKSEFGGAAATFVLEVPHVPIPAVLAMEPAPTAQPPSVAPPVAASVAPLIAATIAPSMAPSIAPARARTLPRALAGAFAIGALLSVGVSLAIAPSAWSRFGREASTLAHLGKVPVTQMPAQKQAPATAPCPAPAESAPGEAAGETVRWQPGSHNVFWTGATDGEALPSVTPHPRKRAKRPAKLAADDDNPYPVNYKPPPVQPNPLNDALK
jgi:hypothetical protein